MPTKRPSAHVLVHAVWTTCRQYWMLPAVGFLVFFLLIPGAYWLYPSTDWQFGLWNPAADGIFLVSMTGYFSPLVMLAFGIFLALALFGFLFRPHAVAAYFSLGITRGKLFGVRYLFGVASLLSATVLPLTIGLLINIWQKGFSTLLLATGLYLMAGLFLTGLVAFTLGVLFCTLSGTHVEAAVFTLIASAAPLLLVMSTGALLRALLPGSPVDGMLNIQTPNMDEPFNGYAVSLTNVALPLSPATFFIIDFMWFGSIPLGDNEQAAYYQPKWGPLAAWLAAALLLAALAWLLFRRRRGERADMSGQNRWLGSIAAALPAYAAFAAISANLPLSAPVRIALGALVFAAVFGGVGLLACWGLSRFRRLLPALAGCGGAVAVGAVLLATGGLGFSARVPAVEDIASAEISYRGDANLVPLRGIDSNDYTAAVIRYTSREDLTTVTRLHRELVKTGRPVITGDTEPFGETAIPASPLYVRYTLKNGRTLLRVYDATTPATMAKLLELDKTDAVIEARAAMLEQRICTENQALSLTDPFFQTTAPLELEAAERRVLLDCLLADLRDQTLADRYCPQQDVKTILQITRTESDPLLHLDETKSIYLTASFHRTLAFLADRRITLPQSSFDYIEKIGVSRISPFESNFYSGGLLYSQDLFAQGGTQQPIGFSYSGQIPWPTNKLDILIPHLRSCHYQTEPLYVVDMCFRKEGATEQDAEVDYIYKILPASALGQLPADLREQLLAITLP